MPSFTVPGAGGDVPPLEIDGVGNAALAADIIGRTAEAFNNGALQTVEDTDGPPYSSVPDGNLGQFIITQQGRVAPPADYGIVVDAATAPVSVQGSGNTTVLAGAGALAFYGAGSTDELAAGGGNDIVLLASGSTNSIATGAGNDTIVANGRSTIDAGAGANLLFGGGSGSATVFKLASSSNTSVVAGAGDETIYGGAGANVMYLGAGASTVVEGAGADTVDAGNGPATVYGGSGGALVNPGIQSLTFVAGTGPSTIEAANANPAVIFGPDGSDVTIKSTFNNDFFGLFSGAVWVGGAGSATVDGGQRGPSLILFGDNGTNLTYVGSREVQWNSGAGSETVSVGEGFPYGDFFGHANGNLTFINSGGANDAALIAGDGNETLNAAASTSGLYFYPGTGSSRLLGGSGYDVFTITDPGSTTASGGGGRNEFNFNPMAENSDRAVIITDFSSIDRLQLLNYTFYYGPNAIVEQTVANGSTVLSLKDGTSITLAGVTNLNPNQITQT